MPHDDEIRNHCRVYVGNLPPDVREKDVEDLFKKYGKITMIDLKMKRGPPFAFLEYNNERDANEAVKYRDGYDYDGYRLRVERPRGLPRTAANNYTRGPPMRRSYSGGGDRGGDRGGGDRGGGRDGGGRGAPGRGRYRISVTGLPPTGSWQDLKDHFREAGEVAFTDVRKDGSGVVEFVRYEDMKYALKKLDDTKFKSHQGETAYIRVCEEGERPPTSSSSRKRSRSRSKSRSRSRSASPPRRSRASPTYSPVRNKRSASGSRSSSPRSRSRS